LAAGHVERTINSSDLILGLLQHWSFCIYTDRSS
jgi:hypothetical protein